MMSANKDILNSHIWLKAQFYVLRSKIARENEEANLYYEKAKKIVEF